MKQIKAARLLNSRSSDSFHNQTGFAPGCASEARSVSVTGKVQSECSMFCSEQIRRRHSKGGSRLFKDEIDDDWVVIGERRSLVLETENSLSVHAENTGLSVNNFAGFERSDPASRQPIQPKLKQQALGPNATIDPPFHRAR